ncbi:MAG: DUF4350 domain-containing protein [Euryarchaeota archaeon]|nr:DUF4350 domain-containing protein [Euryarchaeota archaeon]
MVPPVLEGLRRHRLRTSVVVTVAVLGALGLADLLTGVHQLGAYDDDWNDLSKFRGALDAAGYRTSSVISSPLLLNSSEGFLSYEKLLVVIGVERPYLPQEVDTIDDFVARGGFLLLADDFGYGNSLAQRFGLSFYGRRLYSSSFEHNSAFVRVNDTIGGASYEVLLDRPTALERIATPQVLAWTHPDTWMDENGNGERDFDEESGALPVVGFAGHGDGYVLAVSDPGLFINDLWGRAGNAEYVMALLRDRFPTAREVVFDETRHKPDTVREGAWRSGLFLGVLLLHNLAGKTLLGILALVAVGGGILAVRTPAEWRHEDTLRERTFHHLGRLSFDQGDRARLRRVLLEKARIRLNMYPDEFGALDREGLREIIGEERLVALAEDPERVPREELEGLAALVRQWDRR